MLTEAILRCTKVLVAAVNGPAIGVGVTLLPHCDVVYAAGTATFATPFVRIAVVPEFASTYTLPRILGPALANDMVLFDRVLTAREACTAGLVAAVFPRQELLAETRRRVDAALAHPLAGASLTLFKSMMRKWTAPTIARAHELELVELLRRMDNGETVAAVMQLMAARSSKSASAAEPDTARAKL